MKRVIIGLFAIISVMTAAAQNKGEMYAGGAIGVGTTSNFAGGSSATTVSFGLAPEFGYFAAKNFRIGASVAYSLSNNGGVMHAFEIMPNMAYYVKMCDKFYYTPGLKFGFTLAAGGGYVMPGFGVGVNLGSFEFRPTAKFGCEVNILSFSYALLRYPGEGAGVNGITFNLGISPSVGLKYYF